MLSNVKKSKSRVAARDRNITTHSYHVEGLVNKYPFSTGDIIYFSNGDDLDNSKLFPMIVKEVGVPIQLSDETFVEGVRVKSSDGFCYVPGYQLNVKVASYTKYTQEELDKYEGVIG